MRVGALKGALICRHKSTSADVDPLPNFGSILIRVCRSLKPVSIASYQELLSPNIQCISSSAI